MELYIKSVDLSTMTEFLIKDPLLCAMALCDQSLKDLDAGLGYNPDPCALLGFYNEKEELLCCIQATLFTDVTVNFHVFMKTTLHHTGILRKMHKVFIKYLKDNTPCTKMMCISPSVCPHVKRAVEGLGFTLEGTLTKAITWREQIVDLHIYGQIIDR